MIEKPACPSTQSGQVVPLMAGVIVLVALCALGVAFVGRQAVERARAQNAADAAALAAAVQLDPRRATVVAQTITSRNGARLVELHRDGAVVVVHVTVAGHGAVAAARPVAGPSGASP